MNKASGQCGDVNSGALALRSEPVVLELQKALGREEESTRNRQIWGAYGRERKPRSGSFCPQRERSLRTALNACRLAADRGRIWVLAVQTSSRFAELLG